MPPTERSDKLKALIIECGRSAAAPIADMASVAYKRAMTAKLTLRYEFSTDPNDDFGWLALAVETDRFTGRGGFWVQWQDVTEMAPKLDAYPFSSEHPFVEEWGHCDSDGSNYEVIVGISILPANKTGDLDVIVKIADHIDTRRQCQAVFRTNYPDTANFASELRAVMGRQRHNAVLLGRNVS